MLMPMRRGLRLTPLMRTFLLALEVAALPSLARAGASVRDDDSPLAQAVAAALRVEGGLSRGTQIEVSVSHGVVALRGRAANLYERELTARLAEAVPGVSELSVSIEIPPAPGGAGQAAFEAQVLSAARIAGGDDVKLTIVAGRVEVEFESMTSESAWQVLEAVKKVPGVSFADSHATGSSRQAEDAAVLAAVNAALAKAQVPLASEEHPEAVAVEVHAGMVTLRGTVATLLEAQHARDVTVALPEVRSLHDEVKVRFRRAPHAAHAPARSDRDIEREVREQLARALSEAGTSIHVNCIDGTVALSGEVQNTDLMAVAEQAASGVTGVTGIVNNLKVRPSPGS